MSDLISREEVLKMLEDMYNKYENYRLNTPTYSSGGKDACEEIEEEIKKLPSKKHDNICKHCGVDHHRPSLTMYL